MIASITPSATALQHQSTCTTSVPSSEEHTARVMPGMDYPRRRGIHAKEAKCHGLRGMETWSAVQPTPELSRPKAKRISKGSG